MALTLAAQMLAVSVAIIKQQEFYNSAAKEQTWSSEYDYVVVGAGSAGSIVASRLSEDGTNSVLLLEAGGPATYLTDIPGAINQNIASTPDWGYVTTPQKYASQAFVGNSSPLEKAKVIGGSAMVNLMAYNRGNIRDYDMWANEYGAGSLWSFNRLLPYFKKLETFYNASYYPHDLRFHGRHGPITVSVVPNADPIHYKYQEAFHHAGYMKNDYNGPQQLGTGKTTIFVSFQF